MFCSNCGKTMPANEKKCPFCGLEIADSSFFESTITSCQPKNMPGEEFEASGKYANVTRTVFTGNASRGEGYGGTTYRAAYEPEPEQPAEPEEAETAAEAAEQPAAPETEEAPAEEEGLQEPGDVELTAESVRAIENDSVRLDSLRMRPIEASAPKGISQGVRDYMQAMKEEDEQAKAKPKFRLRFNSDDEDEEDEALDVAETPVKKRKPVRSDEETETEDEEDEKQEDKKSLFTPDSNMEDEDEEPSVPRRTSRKHTAKKKAQIGGIVRVAGVALLIVAVLFGVIAGIAVVTKKTQKSPIPGVSLDLYNKGTALIKEHVTSDYKKQCMQLYSTGILDFTQKLENDKEAVSALSAEATDVFDGQFIEALNTIQTNVNNALTMDALATLQTDPAAQTQAIADSNTRWSTINESVDGLLNATTTVEIEAIIRGEKIEIPKETSKPTPTPVVYTTLSKGMKVAAVTELQERLMQLGFYDDEIDGAYGNKTVTAVKLFQSAAGFEVTGTADPQTLAAVFDDNAPRTGSMATPAPDAEEAAPAPEG